MEYKKIGVIGDGGWGTTLAILLAGKGCSVTLWGAFPAYVEELKVTRENRKFLPGVRIPDSIKITSRMDEAVNDRDAIVLAVPAQFMRPVLTLLKMENYSGKTFVSLAKGIENSSLKRMTEVIRDVIGGQSVVVLSGPTIALEVANGVPTTAVVSSKDDTLSVAIRDLFATDRFRLYTCSDCIGVEIGGAIKNVIAIAAGVSDSLGFGTNAKAALLTRGLVEISRFGVAMGAKRETFYGLGGLGDLTTTCMSQYSRNRWLGEEIGKGKRLKEVLSQTDMVVEGVTTSKSAYDLSVKHRVDMPITAEIYRVLYEGKDPRRAVHDLMTRAPKKEEDF